MHVTAFKEALFARGAALGFTDMEVYYQSNGNFATRIFKGEIDSYTLSVEGGLSFRGLYAGKMGYAYTELIDESSVELLLENARASAEIKSSDELEPMCEGGLAYQPAQTFAPALAEITAEQKIALAKVMEAECMGLDPRVVMVNYCVFQSFENERLIANTRGLACADKANGALAYVSAVVKEGEETKTAFRFVTTQEWGSIDPKALAAEAVGEALSFLGAEPVPTGAYPVLLRHTAAASLLSTFMGGFLAINVQKGKSLLKGKLGQAIAGENITIVDDPFMAGGFSSRAFDAEGVPSRRLALIEGGVLRTYLHNLKSAGVDGVESTGHAYKPSYKGAIGIAPTNLYVEPGTQTLEELVESTEEGVIITDLQGLHSGANAISGDFSLAAHGYYVKGGKIVRPVNQITVAGNFYAMLSNIEAVGSDLKFMPDAGYVGSPTLKVRSLAITGK